MRREGRLTSERSFRVFRVGSVDADQRGSLSRDMLGLGSYQGCSEALHERPVDRRAGGARMGAAATATATAKWR